MIGHRHDTRHACGTHHLPNCHNPGLNLTACVCGDVWWPGIVGTWHSRPIRERVTVTDHYGTYMKPGDVIAWDRYFLHLPECPEHESATADEGHLCRDVAGTTYHEAFGAPA